MTLDAVNSNTFQDDAYKFGSLTHVDDSVRRKAVGHHGSTSTTTSSWEPRTRSSIWCLGNREDGVVGVGARPESGYPTT
ncbi:MAG: hypothetical protein ACRYG2_32800 [Janthinobacterium lividum]